MAGILRAAIRHPGQFIGVFNSRNIKLFFRMSRQNGVRRTMSDMMRVLNGSAGDINRMNSKDLYDMGGFDGTRIEVPCAEDPEVSIIIPVYNQFEYTYSCIRSIVDTVKDIGYEIIVADDCSTDTTVDITEYLPGVGVVRNETNLRFTLNCNNASGYAKGKYLVFLNNDTIVKEDWLASLLRTIESSPDIGMVGSKLVYPDGSLQEAGSIVWNDGSAWNYGRGSNPELPEFNYVRDTDYISGASILISRSLWEEIGRFDERYAPAYCEDSDLAFKVRAAGKRVVYQPQSVVIHFEGISNGKLTDQGLKSYQVANIAKFGEKWKDVLEREQLPPGTGVFAARGRTKDKRTVVFVDEHITPYDTDAGSRSISNYIRLMVKAGYSVKLIPDDFLYNEKYASYYQQMGVEVLYGGDARKGWKDWFLRNADRIDYAVLSRPLVTDKYIRFIKKNTKIRVIYNICDLHFIRLRREYELTGDRNALKEAKQLEPIEYRCMNAADYVLTLSTMEKEVIDDTVPGNKARLVPIFGYDLSGIPRRRGGMRNTVMFVGNFRHRPNSDAAVHMAKDILPKVREEIPDCRLLIIGGNADDSVRSLEGDGVEVVGFVSEGPLRDYYLDCSVCAVPLRYGAGVKGKLVEAMYWAIPTVSTSVGIEGLQDIDQVIPPMDDDQSFADEIVRMIKDPSYSEGRSEGYRRYMQEHFSEDSCLSALEDMMPQ